MIWFWNYSLKLVSCGVTTKFNNPIFKFLDKLFHLVQVENSYLTFIYLRNIVSAGKRITLALISRLHLQVYMELRYSLKQTNYKYNNAELKLRSLIWFVDFFYCRATPTDIKVKSPNKLRYTDSNPVYFK